MACAGSLLKEVAKLGQVASHSGLRRVLGEQRQLAEVGGDVGVSAEAQPQLSDGTDLGAGDEAAIREEAARSSQEADTILLAPCESQLADASADAHAELQADHLEAEAQSNWEDIATKVAT